jgi:uncharacterized membrane protein
MQLDTARKPNDSLIKILYLIYALHIFSAVSGLLTPAFVVTAFVTGWPSVIALILSYVWRGDAEGSYLSTHFDWLIRTFWYALMWFVIAALFIFTIIGSVIGLPMLLIVGIWVVYRLARGLFALNGRRIVA